ncbi:MAG: hypothetical protein JNN12_06865 [Bacteroidetes Order II. Incertae sedis bacterium]|nr:hypothetical protein [Bacteroidetes Order II. bacterium]
MKTKLTSYVSFHSMWIFILFSLSACDAAQNAAYWNQVRENQRNQEWAAPLVGSYSGVIYSESELPTPLRQNHSFSAQVYRVSNQEIRVVIPDFVHAGRTYRADFQARLGLTALFSTDETVGGMRIHGSGMIHTPEGATTKRLTLRLEFADATRSVVLNMNPVAY